MHSLHSVIFCFVVLARLVSSSDTDPNASLATGTAACRTLKSSLGSKYSSAVVNTVSYATSRDYWNSRQDLYNPTCIVYPTTSEDVSTALKAIKSAKSRFAIKAGGHNPNNFFSSVDRGVLIDLVNMNNKTYDAAKQLVTYGPGNRFQDIYTFTEQYGVTVVGARLGGVGSGLALGGGLSYLSNQYGMAADGFRALEVVLPSGNIVTASADTNPDLFFVMRGGGGNAYGVVTSYTVAARTPSPTVYSGNIVYLLDYAEQIRQASFDFARYNTDPKAAVIVTWEEIPLPDLTINLSEFALVFLVYDGSNPGDAFKNFTKIPSVLNDCGARTYTDTVNNLVPFSTVISQAYNTFRVTVGSVSSNKTFSQAYDSWKAWATKHKLDGSYLLTSLDFEPVPRSLTDASKAQGGNAMQMPDGPYYWLNWLVNIPPTVTSSQYASIQASFKAAQEAAENEPGLPLFINDAAYDQNPLASFSTYPRLKATKNKYDPDGFFSQYTGGWAFP